MSSKDLPEPKGKTVIRPGGAPTGPAKAPNSIPAANATIFYDRPLPSPPPRTVVQSAELPSATVFSAGAGDWGYGSGAAVNGLVERPPLEGLLQAIDATSSNSPNPYVAAAMPLLALLGRLRLLAIAPDAGPLATAIAERVREFDKRLGDADGLLPADIRIAKYALCETADDIVQNLPGFAAERWKPYSMLSQFFKTNVSGTGFFEALNKLLADPEAHTDLLEFMHACLSLGFQGQYRGRSDSDGLERVRRDVYESVRYFRKRPEPEISPHWQGLSEMMASRKTPLPLWAFAAGAVAMVAAAFFAMRVLIADEGEALAAKLIALNPAGPTLIERTAAPPPEPPPPKPVTGQLERIRTALAADIKDGNIVVAARGEFIVVEINNSLLFDPGRAETKAGFAPLGERIATVLAAERGQLRIVGHTDNAKPRKTSAFKSNYDLSVARAKAVAAILSPKLGGDERVLVEGKGEDEPVADNKTADGRNKNRRVELLLPREGTP